MWHPHCKSVSTDISARQGRICFVECLRKRTLWQLDAAVHKVFPLAEQTVAYLSLLFVSHLASLTNIAVFSMQRHQGKKKKKVAKTTKEKGENSNQMSNLVGYTLTRPASGEKHGNWAVVGDTISGHRELTPKHIPHLNFCRSLFSFSAHPASSCFALIGTGFKNE